MESGGEGRDEGLALSHEEGREGFFGNGEGKLSFALLIKLLKFVASRSDTSAVLDSIELSI